MLVTKLLFLMMKTSSVEIKSTDKSALNSHGKMKRDWLVVLQRRTVQLSLTLGILSECLLF